MHPGMRMPMGPQGMMPPPHPIQMEMQHLHQQLNHLYNQPQNPQIQQQVGRLFIQYFWGLENEIKCLTNSSIYLAIFCSRVH
jgi:hypothetical protein